jgi:hypothetical protein
VLFELAFIYVLLRLSMPSLPLFRLLHPVPISILPFWTCVHYIYVKPLNFGIGYLFQPSNTCLMVGRPR